MKEFISNILKHLVVLMICLSLFRAQTISSHQTLHKHSNYQTVAFMSILLVYKCRDLDCYKVSPLLFLSTAPPISTPSTVCISQPNPADAT